jgi:hypothetical protein
MSYFIFLKNSDNIERTIYKIAENQSDLNNINITQSDYKIIQDSQENFNNVKLNVKHPLKYNGDVITFDTVLNLFLKNELEQEVNNYKIQIKQFTTNNPNHPLFSRWDNYYNQLNNLNLDNINYPLTVSLTQYLDNLGQPSYNILQLP